MIEGDRTQWDVCLSENAQAFVAEEIKIAEITGAPMRPDVFLVVLADLADMARAALVAVTGWPAAAFDTPADAAALERFVGAPAESPLYARAVASALALALHNSKRLVVNFMINKTKVVDDSLINKNFVIC